MIASLPNIKLYSFIFSVRLYLSSTQMDRVVAFTHSTVTDLAKFLGWSTLHPLATAMW